MTREEARRIDDQIQEEMVAQQNADLDEAGDLGDLLVLLLVFVLVVALVSGIVVAWFVTGNPQFAGALLLVMTGVAVGSAYVLRKPTGGAR